MKRFGPALVVIVGVLTLGGFGLAFWIWWFGRRDRARPADVVIVLGAKVFADGRPSRVLVGRVERGVAALREGLGRRILLTGGGVPSEAAVALTLATSRGAPRSAFLLEEQARSTRENARLSLELLRREGGTTANVVTDRFHLFRARQLFRREGLEVGTIGAATAPMPRRERVYWVLREALALLPQPRVVFARRPR